MRAARRLAVAIPSLLVAAGLSACSGQSAPSANTEVAPAAPTPILLDAHDASAASIAASGALFSSSDLAFVATPETVEDLVDDAHAAAAPLLIAGPGLADELARLDVATVAAVDPAAIGDVAGRTVITVAADGVDPQVAPAESATAGGSSVLLTDGSVDQGVQSAVAANVEIAGGTTASMPEGDPRATSETVALAHQYADATVLALGDSFGAPEEFAERFASASTQPDLPGGGQLPLKDKMLIAEYGHPGDPVLGVLGERDLDAAVEHVKTQAAAYEGLTDKTIVPTFEIITTIASGSKGDGDYSDEADIETLRPWVERAGEEGIYVVLDLQPGTDTFLEQAKQYEELLKLPHVGLALDPEWKLLPGQQHLEQIGSVETPEINETLAWLAELTASNGLPQKVVVLHQFRLDMIPDRDQVDTSHDELAILVHVDGHGNPGDKMATWETLNEDLPEGMQLGWKNFIDEDQPMFTPEETVAIEPHPVFVSYQ